MHTPNAPVALASCGWPRYDDCEGRGRRDGQHARVGQDTTYAARNAKGALIVASQSAGKHRYYDFGVGPGARGVRSRGPVQ